MLKKHLIAVIDRDLKAYERAFTALTADASFCQLLVVSASQKNGQPAECTVSLFVGSSLHHGECVCMCVCVLSLIHI